MVEQVNRFFGTELTGRWFESNLMLFGLAPDFWNLQTIWLKLIAVKSAFVPITWASPIYARFVELAPRGLSWE